MSTRMVAALVLWALVTSAFAEQPPAPQVQRCGRYTVLDRVAREYGEYARLHLTADQLIVELRTNPATQTWTISVLRPDGTACIMGSGQGIDAIEHDGALERQPESRGLW